MRTNLIFSRSANNGELSQERIRQLAPAVFADSHKETLSQRYVPLNTASLLPVLDGFGYVPTQAVQRFGNKGNAEHKHHMVAFAHRDTMAEVSGIRPEIILYNSHDGTGAVRLFAGAFRFICSNGIVAGDGFQSRMYHSNASLRGFEDVLTDTIESLPRLMDRIDNMRNVTINYDTARTLAERAAQVRWETARQFAEDVPVRGTFATDMTVRDLLKVQRSSDDYMDAWTVFNRIQENVVRGNAIIKSFTDKAPDGAYRKARPISSAAEAVRVNRELWNIAEEVVFA